MTAEYLRSLGLFRRANKRYLLTASVNIAIVSTAELQAIKRDVYMSVCLSVCSGVCGSHTISSRDPDSTSHPAVRSHVHSLGSTTSRAETP